MSDYLELGPVPTDETCQQVGTPEYNAVLARRECNRFANQLGAAFGHRERFVVRSNPHDFGIYYEVVVTYDLQDRASIDWAFDVEKNLPERWAEEEA